MRVTIILAIISIRAFPIFGQGSFIIEKYSYKDYNGHRQNWAITQDTSGRVFFGNNNSLIWFDGDKWFDRHISNNTIIRSLLTSSDGKIYYGTVGDYGFLEYDSTGSLHFRSLLDEIPDSLEFEEIYKIQEFDSAIYFQSYDYLFKFKDNRINVIKNELNFSQLTQVGNRLFVRLIGEGLAEIVNDTLISVPGGKYFANRQFFSAEDLGDEYLFASRYSGLSLFNGQSINPLNNELSKYLAESDLYRSERINDSQIAFATISAGIVIANIEDWSYRVIDESGGLSNNQVHELFVDRSGVLWAVSDNGISRILVNEPLLTLNTFSGLPGNIVDVKQVEEFVYVATSNKLYSLNTSINELVELPVYFPTSMVRIKNQLLVSSLIGIHKIDRNEVKEISSEHRFRQIKSIDLGANKVIVGVNDNGLTILELSGNHQLVAEKKSLITISLNFVEVDGDSIWGLTRWGEVYRFNADGIELNRFDLELPEGTQVRSIGNYENVTHVGTDAGLFSLNNNGFNKLPEINEHFESGVNNTKQFFRFENCGGQLFVFYNRKIVRFNGNEVYESPYQLIGDEEEINSIECFDNNIWFGGNAGVFIANSFIWEFNNQFNTNITSSFVRKDSLIYGGFGEPVNPIVLPYEDNELRFNYAAASFIDPERNTYSYKLEGFDADWSEWSLETQKDYTNIPEGDYVFRVRSRNVYEVEGEEDQIAFSVLPPWYRTWWAYVLYVIGISGLIYSGHRIRLNQLLKVEKMRTKIASDLHDEVSATLTGISYFAEAAKTDHDEEKKSHFINLITESAGDAKEKITDIVWSITPENDDWEIFLAKCRRYASDLLESKGLDYDFKITESIPGKLNMNTRQHLWMIFKEILTNSIRHSDGDRIDLIIDTEGDVFKMVIQDNGKGFDISSKNFGNGLRNIQQRAESIKANLELDSEFEMGTRWILELKL